MANERVEQAADQKSIFEVVNLLEEVGRILPVTIDRISGARSVPHVPFIEGEEQRFAGTTLAANNIAHGTDFLDLAIHRQVHRQVSGAVPTSFLIVAPVTMERDAIGQVVALFEHLAIPFKIGRHEWPAGPAGDELDGWIDDPHL